MSPVPNTEDKFWATCMPEPNSGCWLWMGSLRNGYGSYRFQGKEYFAHRLAHLFAKGTLPDELDVCHKCDVPCCINPAHLFLGSHADNMADMIRKKRHNTHKWQGELHGNAKLTNAEARAIRESTLASRQLAKYYGVSKTAILYIRRGQTWKTA